MSATGIVTAAIQLGVDAILVRPHRAFGPFSAQVTIKESHVDELEITQQPVDQGAAITDHAFAKPAELTIECAWSDSPPAANVVQSLTNAVTGTIDGINSIISGNAPTQSRDIYQKLLLLQQSRVPMDVFTGKRHYVNMLIAAISVETDKESENALVATIRFRQVLLAQVSVRTIGAPAANQTDAAATLPLADKGTKQLASATSFNPQAALSAGINAVTAKAQAAIHAAVSSVVSSLTG